MLLQEGILRLGPFAPVCQTVDVATLIADAARARDKLASLGPDGLREIDVASVAPRVRLRS